MSRNWTPEERRKHAQSIREWKPWESSTGPKTESGKNTVRKNALRHGFRSEDMKQINALLRAQQRFLKALADKAR